MIKLQSLPITSCSPRLFNITKATAYKPSDINKLVYRDQSRTGLTTTLAEPYLPSMSHPTAPHDSFPLHEASKSKPGQSSWIEETLNAAKNDCRRQPWKETFGETLDCSLDNGEDLVRIERNVGGGSDPDCPFRTQGSSLAA
jgi:hypothetical protein